MPSLSISGDQTSVESSNRINQSGASLSDTNKNSETKTVSIDQKIFKGKAPWTLSHAETDHLSLKNKKDCKPIEYPKPDGKLTFDKLTNVSFSSTYHEENQPCHLKLTDDNIPISNNNPSNLF